MSNWKSKLFGDNSLNFYGWLFAGSMIVCFSLVHVCRALGADGGRFSRQESLLLAIWLILLGQFLLALQKYLARVGRTLEAKQNSDPSCEAPHRH